MSPPPRSWKRGGRPACTGCTMRPTRKSSRRCAIFSTRSAFPAWRWPRGRSSGRSCSTASCARAAETPERRCRQRTGPALPGAGRLQPEQYRPFRSGAAALRPFHLADPALCRSPRASRADRRRRRRRARPATASARSREHISATERRAAAAERGALDRYRATLLARRDRHRLRGADQRGGAVRPVRDLARERRRRAGPDIDAAGRLLRPRRSAATDWSAAAPAGSSRSATRSARSWSRRTRSAAGWCSGSTIIRLPAPPRRASLIGAGRAADIAAAADGQFPLPKCRSDPH